MGYERDINVDIIIIIILRCGSAPFLGEGILGEEIGATFALASAVIFITFAKQLHVFLARVLQGETVGRLPDPRSNELDLLLQ